MGRSVMTLNDATVIAYDYLEPDEASYREQWDDMDGDEQEYYDFDFDRFMWNLWNEDYADVFHWYLVGIQDMLAEQWKSFEPVDRWIGQELHVIAENAHSLVTISEYGGSVAICLGPNYDRGDYWRDPSEISGLGENWRNKISERFEKRFSTLQKLGTFSNGESVFQKIGA